MLTTKQKTFNICSLVCNATVFILGFIAIVLRVADYSAYGNGINDSAGGAFRFFTVDGNIYCVLAAAVMLAFNIINIVKKEYRVPFWAYMMKLASAVTGFVVFLVVMVALIGNIGEVKILGYVMFTLHAVNPTLCVVSFLVFERTDKKVNLKQTLLGALPVFIYAVLAIILCASKAWTGDEIPYPFLDVHANPE